MQLRHYRNVVLLGYKTSTTLATKSNEIHYFVASSCEFLATKSNVSNDYWYEY